MRTVALYIYIDELIDSVLTPVAHRLELFADESISITSSIQNFRDLGKVFTDYSKQFTIPASPHNNKILKHWYNSEVGATSLDNPLNVDGAFDHRISYYGFIEIDTIPFRYGKFILKGSKKVNNKIESYSVEFTGNLVQLKERFKDDKLKDLAYFDEGVRTSFYDELNHAWTLTQVKNRVIDDTYNVLYPIIGTKRKLYLDSGVPSQDISHVSGQLKFDEIFPAVRVSKILEYIQSCYSIGFEGAFVESQTFNKLFLYCKNQDELNIKTEQIKVNFTAKDADTEIRLTFGGTFITTVTGAGFTDLDLDTDVCTLSNYYLPDFYDPPVWYPPPTGPFGGLNTVNRSLRLTVTTASLNAYNVHIYKNGILYLTVPNIVGSTAVFVVNSFAILPVDEYEFYISSANGVTFTTELRKETWRQSSYQGQSYAETQILTATSASQTTTSNIDIKSFIPDMTVESFVTGLIKMSNLMVIPTSENTFYLQPLNDYYNDGRTIDITKYVQTDEMTIDPPQLYKKIAFKYEKSPNILNEAFRGLFNKEYGDLSFENKNSAFAETYEVALPFENFMFERETGTDFMTATIFDKDSNPYIPKPSLIYCNGIQEVTPDIRIADNSTHFSIDNYVRFSNELPLAATDLSYTQSLNWGAEISAWDLVTNFTGLYQKFYSEYIENLFNQRARIIKFKAILPNSLLCSLRLRDKLIVSNKRYIINTMTPELTSGNVSFELILDNKVVTDTNDVVLRLTNLQTVTVDNTAQQIELQVFLKDNDLWRSKTATGFLAGTYSSGGNVYKDGILTVSVPANATASNRSDNVILEYFKGGDSFEIYININQYA